MSPKYEDEREGLFEKRLSDLTPPKLRTVTPYNRFTAGLQLLNHYFWSTEVALSTFLTDYRHFEDEERKASEVLEHVPASGFTSAIGSGRPHYHASMGSLLVQVRWNLDALGRHAMIEAVSIAERFIAQRVQPILRHTCPTSFAAVRDRLVRNDVVLDAEGVYRAQLVKLLRNHIVHDRTTIHSFPSAGLLSAVRSLENRSDSWTEASNWDDIRDRARNELLHSTRHAGDTYDLPQLFFAAIYSLSRIRKLGDDVEEKIRSATPEE